MNVMTLLVTQNKLDTDSTLITKTVQCIYICMYHAILTYYNAVGITMFVFLLLYQRNKEYYHLLIDSCNHNNKHIFNGHESKKRVASLESYHCYHKEIIDIQK